MHSHSATSTFNNCPWKHRLLALGYKEQVIDAKSNDRQWGIALHRALQTLYTGGDKAAIWQAFVEAYPVDLDAEDKLRTQEAAHETLAAYMVRWCMDDKNWEVLASEFHNPEDEREAEGHLVIDLVMKHKASSSIYFWDHKVKRKWDGSGKSYELDAQLSRYASYVKERWGDCAGALVNVIVPSHRERKWKDRPAGWDVRLDRVMFSRTSDQIEAWRQSQGDWEALMAMADEGGVWPKHYGPLCSYCSFFSGCYGQAQGSGMEIFDSLYRPSVPIQIEEVEE